MGWFQNFFRPKPKPKPPTPTPPPVSTDFRLTLLESHNRLRAAKGRFINSLVLNEKLNNSAQYWASWMALNNRMVHETASSSLRSRIEGAGYSIWTAGENIAEGYPSVEAVMAGWINSPGHYANIMNSNFADVGFGMVKNSSGVIFWCADFGKTQLAGFIYEDLDLTQPQISLSGPLRA